MYIVKTVPITFALFVYQISNQLYGTGFVHFEIISTDMAKQSAGILVYRKGKETEVFLIHPGGPFFARKDDGVWSVPKGEYEPEEDPLHAAKREFEEETSQKINGDFIPLLPVKQKGGKVVRVWAVEGEVDADSIVSNTFQLAWPPHSNKIQTFPEVDKGAWFPLDIAREKINAGQIPLLDQLSVLIE